MDWAQFVVAPALVAVAESVEQSRWLDFAPLYQAGASLADHEQQAWANLVLQLDAQARRDLGLGSRESPMVVRFVKALPFFFVPTMRRTKPR